MFEGLGRGMPDEAGSTQAQSWQSAAAVLLVATLAAFLSLAIPLVVFFAFQRYFVQGLLAGSVK